MPPPPLADPTVSGPEPAPALPTAAPGFLGILMLEARFHRPPGDVGHPATWSMPVRFRRVPGASPQRVVQLPVHDLPGLVHQRWLALGPR